MSTYAKCMNEILTAKTIYTNEETIRFKANYSAIIQEIVPQKENDPERINLLATICVVSVGKALIDLGISINIMHLSVIKRISGLGMKQIKMTLKLANRLIKIPSGIAKYVLVKIH